MVKFFPQFPKLKALMSEKADGSMRFFLDGENKKNEANRRKFLKKHGIDPNQLIIPELVHGTYVAKVAQGSDPILRETDGMVTNKNNIFLSVTVADCLPVLFFDPDDKTMGIAHVGWRGLLDGILRNTMEAFFQMEGNTERVKVEIGPAIQKCHYSIRKKDKSLYRGYETFLTDTAKATMVDLPGVARKQLEKLGILPQNISVSPLCTYCEEKRFFSYRRDKPKKVEAMIALIGLQS